MSPQGKLAPPLPANQNVTSSPPPHQLCKSSEQRTLSSLGLSTLWATGLWPPYFCHPCFSYPCFAFLLELSINKLCLHTSRLTGLSFFTASMRRTELLGGSPATEIERKEYWKLDWGLGGGGCQWDSILRSQENSFASGTGKLRQRAEHNREQDSQVQIVTRPEVPKCLAGGTTGETMTSPPG